MIIIVVEDKLVLVLEAMGYWKPVRVVMIAILIMLMDVIVLVLLNLGILEMLVVIQVYDRSEEMALLEVLNSEMMVI